MTLEKKISVIQKIADCDFNCNTCLLRIDSTYNTRANCLKQQCDLLTKLIETDYILRKTSLKNGDIIRHKTSSSVWVVLGEFVCPDNDERLIIASRFDGSARFTTFFNLFEVTHA